MSLLFMPCSLASQGFCRFNLFLPDVLGSWPVSEWVCCLTRPGAAVGLACNWSQVAVSL